MSKQDKNVSIDIFGSLAGIMIILAILSVIGEPDLLDQIIAIAKNYSETIKCNNWLVIKKIWDLKEEVMTTTWLLTK